MISYLPVPGCSLAWSLIDLTPPWQQAPETIVMHHGIGASQDIFAAWLPALLGHYRVLRFDMRGHGRSAKPAQVPQLDLDRLTADLFAVMDAAGVAQAHLIGESIGGTIVLNAALTAPQRVRTVTVSNGAHMGASIQSVAGWGRMIADQGMQGWSAFMMRARFHESALPPAAWHWFESQQAAACPNTVLRMLEALVGADLSAGLPTLRPPLMLLHPDGSPFIPVSVMASLKELVPGSLLHVIGHARHGLPFSHPAVCSRLFVDFLNNQTLSVLTAPPRDTR